MGMVWLACMADDAQVEGLLANPGTVPDFIYEQDENGSAIDLDKQWHAIHHVLTGSADATYSPLSFIIGYFDQIGPDNGYGPAWFIPKDKVAAFHAALAALSDDAISAQYDSAAMVRDQVYIAEALAREGEEGRQFVMEDVGRLREFAAKAAQGGYSAFGMIT